MVFVDSPAEVPVGATLLFSAHGVSPAVRRAAAARGLRVVDATCPFVARIHRQAREFAGRGVPVVMVGHAGHAEVDGIVGEVEYAGGVVRVAGSVDEIEEIDFPVDAAVGVLCQTTFDAAAAADMVKALSSRFARLEKPAAADVCTATRDRQDAVRSFIRSGGDGVLVLGSAGSSNTTRLLEIARDAGVRFAARVATVDEAAGMDFTGVARLGVTAGASTPESLLAETLGVLPECRNKKGD